jgi:uncharacterized protein (DUF58 family)
MTVPAPRLLFACACLTLISLALMVFPEGTLPLLALAIALLVLALVDLALTPGPGRIRITREAPERVSVLATQPIVLRIQNDAPTALHLRIRDSVPHPVQPSASELACLAPPRGELVLAYDIVPPTRGLFSWGPIHLRYRSLLGLWERGVIFPADATLQVYPGVEAIERYQLLARADQLPALGVRRVPFKGASWEFESLREFVNGDDTRLMDWKATARRQKLIVRNQRDERNQSIVILVDAGRLMTAEENGVSKLDLAVNAALLLAHVALSRGDRVGLATFAQQLLTWVQPRPGKPQMRPITDALYNLEGSLTESDHTRALRSLTTRHNKRSLLVFLTDFVDLETAGEMMAAIRLASRRHVVLFCAFNDPFLDRAASVIPATEQEGFRQVMALTLLRERQEVLERLRLQGAQVIDAVPTEVTPALLNKYLEVSLRGLV